jgi:hypothetical protein
VPDLDVLHNLVRGWDLGVSILYDPCLAVLLSAASRTKHILLLPFGVYYFAFAIM